MEDRGLGGTREGAGRIGGGREKTVGDWGCVNCSAGGLDGEEGVGVGVLHGQKVNGLWRHGGKDAENPVAEGSGVSERVRVALTLAARERKVRPANPN